MSQFARQFGPLYPPIPAGTWEPFWEPPRSSSLPPSSVTPPCATKTKALRGGLCRACNAAGLPLLRVADRARAELGPVAIRSSCRAVGVHLLGTAPDTDRPRGRARNGWSSCGGHVVGLRSRPRSELAGRAAPMSQTQTRNALGSQNGPDVPPPAGNGSRTSETSRVGVAVPAATAGRSGGREALCMPPHR